MTPEQWEVVRRNVDRVNAANAKLARLLNAARKALPEDHALHPEIRATLGLTPHHPGD